jgi:predicted HAD superfamily hydrolase
MTKSVYSFDIFETCLVRVLARPSDLFFLLASKMLAYRNLPHSQQDIAIVANIRLRAEQHARRQTTSEDLELKAIYEALHQIDPYGFDAELMMNQELALEKQFLHPVPAMVRQIKDLRSQGKRIIFISDMYLPAYFIRERLLEHDIAQPDDSVFISGAVAKTKYSGSLFRHVLDKLRIDPCELIHRGDNAHSDIKIPRLLGISVDPFDAARPTSTETKLLDMTSEFCPEISLIVGTSRLCRLEATKFDCPPAFAALTCDVVAPVLTAFVHWVLWKAKKKGWKRLYFVSRDGQPLLRIANQLRTDKRGIECRYLHGSRQAWFLPSINTFILKQEYSWLFIPGHSQAPIDILKKLDLTPKDLQGIIDAPLPEDPFWHLQLLENRKKLLLKLMASRPFASLVEQRARKARQVAFAYFQQEGLAECETIILVDVGWTLKAQKALRTCLKLCNINVSLHGLYFGVQAAHVPDTEIKAFDSYILEQPRHFDPKQKLNPIFRNANCIEQVFTAADHGRVTGYRETPKGIEPVLAPPPYQERIDVISLTQSLTQHFAAQLVTPSIGLWQHERVRSWCINLLLDFFSTPDPEQAAALADLAVYDDQNESRARPLARKISLFNLCAILFRICPWRRSKYKKSFDWIEGSIALSSPILRPLLRSPRLFKRLREYRMEH